MTCDDDDACSDASLWWTIETGKDFKTYKIETHTEGVKTIARTHSKQNTSPATKSWQNLETTTSDFQHQIFPDSGISPVGVPCPLHCNTAAAKNTKQQPPTFIRIDMATTTRKSSVVLRSESDAKATTPTAAPPQAAG